MTADSAAGTIFATWDEPCPSPERMAFLDFTDNAELTSRAHVHEHISKLGPFVIVGEAPKCRYGSQVDYSGLVARSTMGANSSFDDGKEASGGQPR